MERSNLEQLTLKELKDEAARYGLPNQGSRNSLIDAIMTHLERNGRTSERTEPVAGPSGEAVGTRSDGAAVEVSRPPDSTLMLTQMMAALNGLMQQQQQVTQLLQTLSAEKGETRRIEEVRAMQQVPRESPSRSTPSGVVSRRTAEGWSSGPAIQAIASQIPEFAGAEEDNVSAWVRRVDKVAEVHQASDGVILLAASSRLTKSARRWYDVQGGIVIESWQGLRAELTKIFDRKMPFYKVMQKVEARKWLSGKESFDDYAIDKLGLMHRVDLKEVDKVHLLSVAEQERKPAAAGSSAQHSAARSKEIQCHNCGKKGHSPRECSAETQCFYCKQKGHRRYECPSLKKKDQRPATKPPAAAVQVAASVDEEPKETVAMVQTELPRLVLSDPVVQVCKMMGENCELTALIDTGSPVSFVKLSVYNQYVRNKNVLLKPSNRNLRNLSDQILEIDGIVRVEISLRQLPDTKFGVDLYVLKDNSFQGDIILGREFITEEKLTLVYEPSARDDNTVNLFSFLPLCVDDEESESSLEQIIENSVIDFDHKVKDKLIETVFEIDRNQYSPVNDNYTVQVRLKDSSVYAYAPRRFAQAERVEIREIIDDLLKRGIVQPSVSSYCARVVLVKKRNGKTRLCIDLRPLNLRVLKQKYPFPVMEECLAQLSNKKVFTLIDLKDSFHQIKVHVSSTQYFAFATPDGQYEYTYLPFGYCEAPAEFQKRYYKFSKN
ncbi:hypothetical protein DMN91_009202 [Ooceraea biroi]|uniref:CCHC-type domain-containing protein n=1 Tax=Ooceraea biroi TaxID=2015173 RepID=A0A3L8DEL7_OOCBI|nr:hypothetical protein DMN91_009202 [Ooceraea biroi]